MPPLTSVNKPNVDKPPEVKYVGIDSRDCTLIVAPDVSLMAVMKNSKVSVQDYRDAWRRIVHSAPFLDNDCEDSEVSNFSSGVIPEALEARLLAGHYNASEVATELGVSRCGTITNYSDTPVSFLNVWQGVNCQLIVLSMRHVIADATTVVKVLNGIKDEVNNPGSTKPFERSSKVKTELIPYLSYFASATWFYIWRKPEGSTRCYHGELDIPMSHLMNLKAKTPDEGIYKTKFSVLTALLLNELSFLLILFCKRLEHHNNPSYTGNGFEFRCLGLSPKDLVTYRTIRELLSGDEREIGKQNVMRTISGMENHEAVMISEWFGSFADVSQGPSSDPKWGQMASVAHLNDVWMRNQANCSMIIMYPTSATNYRVTMNYMGPDNFRQIKKLSETRSWTLRYARV